MKYSSEEPLDNAELNTQRFSKLKEIFISSTPARISCSVPDFSAKSCNPHKVE